VLETVDMLDLDPVTGIYYFLERVNKIKKQEKKGGK